MRARPGSLLPVALCGAALLLGAPARADDEGARRTASRPGVEVPFWLITPPGAKAALILFAGGDGNLRVDPQGIQRKQGNFLVRSRALFARAGFVVALIDTPSDRRDLSGFRHSKNHAQDVQALIGWLRRNYRLRVWLVGTSRGSISAASAAARLANEGPDGLVLTSTVTTTSKAGAHSVRDVKLKNIRVPTLFAHHREDGCYVSAFREIPSIMKKLKGAPETELLSFTGGREEADNACQGRTRHGFLGIETQVVDAITDWISARLGR